MTLQCIRMHIIFLYIICHELWLAQNMQKIRKKYYTCMRLQPYNERLRKYRQLPYSALLWKTECCHFTAHSKFVPTTSNWQPVCQVASLTTRHQRGGPSQGRAGMNIPAWRARFICVPRYKGSYLQVHGTNAEIERAGERGSRKGQQRHLRAVQINAIS